MEEQQEKKARGIGKESQLSSIAAAINPGSQTEASPESTKSMISTFVKHFDTNALDIIREMDDNQEDLIKKMVDEITKLQTKNMQEFEKAIGKIVGISKNMINSNNPKLQQLGSQMQDQAKQELIKSSGYTLEGKDDTFKNRLKREMVGSNFDPNAPKTTGIGKIKGFWADTKNEFKKGAKAAVQEGSVADKIFTSDEDKRTRLLDRVNEEANDTQTESLTGLFKKVLEETLKKGKDASADNKKEPQVAAAQPQITKLTDLTDDQKKQLEQQGISPASENDISYRKDGKPVSVQEINSALQQPASEKQEDSAGISKDASVEAIIAIGASVAILESNSTESLDVFNKMLESLTKLSDWIEKNGDQLLAGTAAVGGGSSLLDGALDAATAVGGAGLGISGATLATGAAVAAGAVGVGYGAYKGYTGYQQAKQTEEATNKDIDEKVSRGELTQAQGIEEKDKAKKTGRVEKSKAVGEGVGIAAGAAGGAALGATYGAALGPLGVAVGGAGGALVGGFLGGGGGKWLGEKAGQVSNWWHGDNDKAEMIDAKVKSGEISKAEGDKLKENLKPSGKDKVVGGLKTAAKVITNPIGSLFDAFSGDDKKQATAEKKKEGGMLSKVAELASSNKGAMIGAALGPVGMAAGALYDHSKKTAQTETGKNIDGSIIEAGTAATKEKMKINVPPPTVINQGGGQGNTGPNITAPGGVRNVRADEPSWLRFQQKRAAG